LLIACVSAAPLFVGAWLRPRPEGFGTHESLGLPPCGFLLVTGKPCVTCCMTTAVSLVAHGKIEKAFVVQPAGALIAIVLASGVWLGLHALASGASPVPLLREATGTRSLLTAGAVLLGAWVYKLLTW
jgi:hypothetical protein